EQLRREKDVVELVLRGSVAESSRPGVSHETRVIEDVLQVGGSSQKRLEWIAVGRIVEVPDDRDELHSFAAALVADGLDPGRLRFALGVIGRLRAETFAL